MLVTLQVTTQVIMPVHLVLTILETRYRTLLATLLVSTLVTIREVLLRIIKERECQHTQLFIPEHEHPCTVQTIRELVHLHTQEILPETL